MFRSVCKVMHNGLQLPEGGEFGTLKMSTTNELK